MDLSIYDIIKGPWVSTKAYRLNQNFQQLVLEVHPNANKSMVAEALKKLFNVEVARVRVVRMKPKKRRVGRITSYTKTRKKAIIVLKEGYSVDQLMHDDQAAPQMGEQQDVAAKSQG